MPPSLSTLFIVAVICLFLGAVAGALLSSLRSEPEEDFAQGQESPPGGRKGRYTPVFRLWREKSTETLIVEVDGKSFLSSAPLSVAQRERLEQASNDFYGWLGILPAPAQPVSVIQQPVAVESTASPSKIPPTIPPVVPASVKAPASEPPLSAVVTHSAAPALPKEEPKSMVGQIDAIIQNSS